MTDWRGRQVKSYICMGEELQYRACMSASVIFITWCSHRESWFSFSASKETQFSNWCTQSSSQTRARTGIARATTSIIMGGARGSAIPQLYTPTHFAVQSTALKIILPVAAWSEYACHAITNEGLVVRSRSRRPAKLLRGCARMRWNVLPSWPASRASHELGIECSSQHTLSAWMRWGGERVF